MFRAVRFLKTRASEGGFGGFLNVLLIASMICPSSAFAANSAHGAGANRSTNTAQSKGLIETSKSGSPRALPADSRPIMDKWAIVIGVDKFLNPTIPTLQYPSKDARDFAKFLVEKGNFAQDHVCLLTNEQATLRNVKETFGDSWLPQRARKDDLVLVFASTHGSPKELDVAGENFLVVYDTEPSRLFSTGIKFADLAPTIKERTGCDRVVLLLDACNSGAASVGGKGLIKTGNFDVTALAGEGQIVISSSAAEQRSFESKRYQNGVFTKQLIATLEANGTNKSLTEAFDDLKERVQNEVQFDRKQTQTPVMRSKWKGGELILLAVPAHPRKVLADPAPTASTISTPQSTQTQTQTKPPSSPESDAAFDRAQKFIYNGKYADALPILINAATSGHAESQHYLGCMFNNGAGVITDYAKAAEWYQMAADQGFSESQTNLARLYEKGQGVVQSNEKAVELYTKAAIQGNALAQCNLGSLYGRGLGVPQNYATAIEWLQKAAAQGHDGALYNLGCMYEKGEGVTASDTKAVEYYQRAADHGFAAAQFNMGLMCYNGKGLPVDYSKALEWFQKAAEQGHDGAQFNIGYMYENGKGVKRSTDIALDWYRKSAKSGNALALKSLKRLNRK